MTLVSTNRVLVPIDFSEASFQALEETLVFVNEPGKVYVVHVLAHLSPIEPGVLWETLSEQSRRESIEKAFWQKCQESALFVVHFDVLIGDPGSEIVDYAHKHKIELIVIPSHGRTGLSRFLMGSVAERVVRCSPCPVLVLRR